MMPAMPHPPPTILLTGFGPFPGVPVNASARLVPRLAEIAARRFRGHRVVAKILPTDWAAGPARLRKLYARERPMVALHFGVSAQAAGFVIETRARNERSSTPDAAGALPPSAYVCDAGPAELRTLLPARTVVARLGVLDIPASLSDDAGSYLCNAILYEAVSLARTASPQVITGFVHIPTHLEWDGALRGGLEIIRVCLGRPPSRGKRARS
jgi:pyroglutamyl-peptidase